MPAQIFAIASEVVFSLLEERPDEKHVKMLFEKIALDSRRTVYPLLGIPSSDLSLESIFGGLNPPIIFSRYIVNRMGDLTVLEKQIIDSFNENQTNGLNAICCNYVRSQDPREPGMFFVDLCVPSKESSMIILNRKQGNLYCARYESDIDSKAYLEAIGDLKLRDRILHRNQIDRIMDYRHYIVEFLKCRTYF